MDIKVHSIDFDADEKLLEFIDEKILKLQKFFDNIVAAEVYLKLDSSESNENKITEIKLLIPGKDMFAKKQCASFEEATDLVTEALRKQLKKYKGKSKMTA